MVDARREPRPRPVRNQRGEGERASAKLCYKTRACTRTLNLPPPPSRPRRSPQRPGAGAATLRPPARTHSSRGNTRAISSLGLSTPRRRATLAIRSRRARAASTSWPMSWTGGTGQVRPELAPPLAALSAASERRRIAEPLTPFTAQPPLRPAHRSQPHRRLRPAAGPCRLVPPLFPNLCRGGQGQRRHGAWRARAQGTCASHSPNTTLCLPTQCSYNAVNGVPSCASDWLLKTLLRGSWEFDGEW